MEELTKLFSYNGNSVTFKTSNGSTYVNATQMAKTFDKQPVHWLNQSGVNDFLNELSKLRNRSLADLVIVIKGGSNPGTWMHEDVALEFSRWLSPAFAIWCNDRIKELITTGKTEIKNQSDFKVPTTFAEALRLAADKEEQLQEANKKLEEQKPQVLFAKALETSNQSILIGQLAKILKQNGIDIGQNRLFEKLREEGYLMKSGEQYNGPTQKSMDLNLFETKTTTVNNPDGSVRVTRTTKVTPKGQSYFINKFVSHAVANRYQTQLELNQ